MRDWASQNVELVNLDQATATFRDHTFSTAMTDWAGAWRNWMRREQKFIEERRPANGATALNRQEALEARNRAVVMAALGVQK